MQGCRHFKRILITCRTQFFAGAEEIQKKVGVVKVEPRPLGQGAAYEFRKLYLLPLTDEQVDVYLRWRYPFWQRRNRREAREVVKKIPLLSVRPMLLAYIPDLLESKARIDYSFQLYEVLVEKWLERESQWVDPEALRAFSERLAVDLFIKREQRGAERIARADLILLARTWNISLEAWQLSGRSLLNCDVEGNYKFAHRSIMEYLFVKRFTSGDKACCGLTWTDQMKHFFHEMVLHHVLSEQRSTLVAASNDLPGFLLGLRFEPMTNLSEKQVRGMLKRNDFFDTSRHNEGKGVQHQYSREERIGDKVVIDCATGLMWQQEGNSKYTNYAGAEKYVQGLNQKKFAGYHDWRLPTLEEAMSLMEPSKKNGDLYIDPIFDKTQRWIWTADKSSAGVAWVVYFYSGICYDVLDRYYDVRAVR